MGCYSVTLPLPEGLHGAKTTQDTRLQENYGVQNYPWGWVNHIWSLAYTDFCYFEAFYFLKLSEKIVSMHVYGCLTLLCHNADE